MQGKRGQDVGAKQFPDFRRWRRTSMPVHRRGEEKTLDRLRDRHTPPFEKLKKTVPIATKPRPLRPPLVGIATQKIPPKKYRRPLPLPASLGPPNPVNNNNTQSPEQKQSPLSFQRGIFGLIPATPPPCGRAPAPPPAP